MISGNSPGRVSTSIEPACCLTMMSWLMERSRLVPSPLGFVVKNRSNIFSFTSSKIPVPLSRILISTRSPRSLIDAVSVGSCRRHPFPPCAWSLHGNRLKITFKSARLTSCGKTSVSPAGPLLVVHGYRKPDQVLIDRCMELGGAATGSARDGAGEAVRASAAKAVSSSRIRASTKRHSLSVRYVSESSGTFRRLPFVRAAIDPLTPSLTPSGWPSASIVQAGPARSSWT